MENNSARVETRLLKSFGRALLAVMLVPLPSLALAQTTSTTTPALTVSQTMSIALQLTGGCSITLSSNMLEFPPTSILETAETASLPVSVTCSPNLAYTVGIGAGTTGSVTARTLSEEFNSSGTKPTGTVPTIPYGLYQDQNDTTAWGDTAGAEESGIGTGSAQTLTIFAQVPALTTVPVTGTYGDSLPVVVTY